jgi:hypothetical protein
MPRREADIVQLRLRVRAELLDRLEASAERNKRSLNYETVERLEASFRRDRESAAQLKALGDQFRLTMISLVNRIIELEKKYEGRTE